MDQKNNENVQSYSDGIIEYEPIKTDKTNESLIVDDGSIENIVKIIDEKYKNTGYSSIVENWMFFLWIIATSITRPYNNMLVLAFNGYFLLNTIILSKMIYNKLVSSNQDLTLGHMFEILWYNLLSLPTRQPIVLLISNYFDEFKYQKLTLYNLIKYKICSAKELAIDDNSINEKDKNIIEYNFNKNEIIPILEYYNLSGLKLNNKNEVTMIMFSSIIVFLFPFNFIWMKSYIHFSLIFKSYLYFFFASYCVTYYAIIKGHYKKTNKINIFDVFFLGGYSIFMNFIQNPIILKTVDFVIENQTMSNLWKKTLIGFKKIGNIKIHRKNIINNSNSNKMIE